MGLFAWLLFGHGCRRCRRRTWCWRRIGDGFRGNSSKGRISCRRLGQCIGPAQTHKAAPSKHPDDHTEPTVWHHLGESKIMTKNNSSEAVCISEARFSETAQLNGLVVLTVEHATGHREKLPNHLKWIFKLSSANDAHLDVLLLHCTEPWRRSEAPP